MEVGVRVRVRVSVRRLAVDESRDAVAFRGRDRVRGEEEEG